MYKILTIALNDLRIFFASRGNLIGLVILPIVFSLLLGWTFGDDDGPTYQRVDLLDLDQSTQSAALIEELRQANQTLLLCPQDNNAADLCRLAGAALTEALVLDRVRRGRSQALLVIPAGYAQAVTGGTAVQLDFYSTADLTNPSPVQRTVEAVLQRTNTAALATGVAGAVLEAIAPAANIPFFSAQTRQQFSTAVFQQAITTLAAQPPVVRFISTKADLDTRLDNGYNQSVPGMGAMYTMFTVMGGMAVLYRERRQWTLQRLVVLPITRAQLLGGKILTYFTLGVIQYLIVFGVGYFVGVDFGRSLLALLLVIVAFVLCITALTFALAPHVTSEGQAEGIARLLGLTLAPLGGAWWPLEIVPGWMRTLGHLSPVAWVMDALHKLIFYNAGLGDVLLEIGVLVGAAAVLFGVAVRTFKYE
jgi:ABC-2 type transport system permease protein